MSKGAKQVAFAVLVVMSLSLLAVQLTGLLGDSQPWLYAVGGVVSLFIVGRYLWARQKS